jgi:hypothetical protein
MPEKRRVVRCTHHVRRQLRQVGTYRGLQRRAFSGQLHAAVHCFRMTRSNDGQKRHHRRHEASALEFSPTVHHRALLGVADALQRSAWRAASTICSSMGRDFSSRKAANRCSRSAGAMRPNAASAAPPTSTASGDGRSTSSARAARVSSSSWLESHRSASARAAAARTAGTSRVSRKRSAIGESAARAPRCPRPRNAALRTSGASSRSAPMSASSTATPAPVPASERAAALRTTGQSSSRKRSMRA